LAAKKGTMTAMDRQIITTRINLLIKYLERMRGFESMTFDNYLNDFDAQLIVERLIQLMVECASDINSYLLVQLYQAAPATYFESFIEAGNRGLVTKELASELAQSAGMRNILVHQYQKINHQLVFDAIPKALKQYQLYIQQITAYLNSLEVNNG